MGIEHATPLIVLAILATILFLLRSIRVCSKRPDMYVRRIPGIDAIDEAIGRAAELGKPAIFSTGLSNLGPVLYACLGVLYHIAQKVALYRNKLIVPQYDPQVLTVVEDNVRDAYRDIGRMHELEPDTVRFLSQEQFAFASGYMGIMHRERPASAFLFGEYAAESLILAESGQQVGAMQVAATVTPEQVPFFIATCDYTVIGEELFASAAYLTREKVQLGSLYAQDRVKAVLLTLILAGIVISTINSIFPGTIPFTVDSLFRLDWSLQTIVSEGGS